MKNNGKSVIISILFALSQVSRYLTNFEPKIFPSKVLISPSEYVTTFPSVEYELFTESLFIS